MFRLFLILALVPRLALADLDTLSSAQAKYGEPSATGSPQIWTYTHDGYHVWQIYDVKGVCIVAEFRQANNGPLSTADCQKLDATNLPAGLVLWEGPGWDITKWPDDATDRDTVSFQYTGEGGTIDYQVIAGQSFSANIGWYYYRVYLSDAGIEAIKALQGGR